MNPLAYYIMIALLGAGAAYGLTNKGKPKPAVSNAKKKLLIVCAGIIALCTVLFVALAFLPPPTTH